MGIRFFLTGETGAKDTTNEIMLIAGAVLPDHYFPRHYVADINRFRTELAKGIEKGVERATGLRNVMIYSIDRVGVDYVPAYTTPAPKTDLLDKFLERRRKEAQ